MVNYEVDPVILQPLLPAGTELDLWNDRCFVSVVGFQFLDTRVLGIHIPFHRDFEEVNLRFYVKRVIGSEEAFITEHYWGYTTQRDGTTLEYRVEHPRWKVWRASEWDFTCDVAALYGPAFAPYLSQPPTSCFLADGSEILVRRGVSL